MELPRYDEGRCDYSCRLLLPSHVRNCSNRVEIYEDVREALANNSDDIGFKNKALYVLYVVMRAQDFEEFSLPAWLVHTGRLSESLTSSKKNNRRAPRQRDARRIQ